MRPTLKLGSIDDAVEIIRSSGQAIPVGNQTKPLLSLPRESASREDCRILDCRGIRGVLEYEPTEFTITALAGTPLREIRDIVGENGQFLPFDPPFVELGSTLGGSIASGMNGSCSLRFGGARDFVLGIRFIDGLGNHVFSGGKVVKNAAGFDIPKFMVGSYGRFGLITEVTLKVFPQPPAFQTIGFEAAPSDQEGWVKKLILTPLEIDAIDFFDSQLRIRVGGLGETIKSAIHRIESLFEKKSDHLWIGEEEQALWDSCNRFDWQQPNTVLFKVPCQIRDIQPLRAMSESTGSKVRFALGGQVAYFAVPLPTAEQLVSLLSSASYRQVAVRILSDVDVEEGATIPSSLANNVAGHWGAVAKSVKQALDPQSRFAV